MKKIVFNLIKKMGYVVHKINPNKPALFKDIKDKEFWNIYQFCKPYTMTSVERMYALYCSVNYILLNDIPGVFVECGVWRGGSAMLIAKMLVNRNRLDRKIYLYDTFDGMTEPSGNDVSINGIDAAGMLKKIEHDKDDPIWCVASLKDVQKNIRLTNIPMENVVYIKGMIENTIPAASPEESIALLRLDTDWYESTKHELNHFFPKLVLNAVIIIDDYGHWEGCKKAVDEYFQKHHINILLNRIDYTCRVGIKSSANLPPCD